MAEAASRLDWPNEGPLMPTAVGNDSNPLNQASPDQNSPGSCHLRQLRVLLSCYLVNVDLPGFNLPRVLVVDHEEQIRNMVRTILTRAGHDVRTASTAQAAIAMCPSPSFFDLVISAAVLPEIDGHELARWFAVKCPNSRFVLMSGSDPGCDECPYLDNCIRVSKPFVPRELVALVSAALAHPVKLRRMDGPSRRE